MKSIYLAFVVFVALIITSSSCSHSAGPADARSPRSYAWSIDTIAYPGTFQTTMVDIGGTSSSNVYIVGSNSDGMANMYHFDGKSWSPVMTAPVGWIEAIQVFASNDIWVVGARYYSGHDSSLIAHFDGSTWKQYPASNGRFLGSLWGSRSNDIWAAGWYGTLLHYDGNAWTNLPMDGRDRYYRLAGLSSQEVYLLGQRQVGSSGSDADYFLLQRYNGSAWLPVDSSAGSYPVFQFGSFGLAASYGNVYTLGYGVFAFQGNTWRQVLKADAPLQDLFASGPDNIIVVGQASRIYHFDGSNWQQLTNVIGDGWWLRAVWGTDRETFIVGHDASGQKSIVLHGK